MNIVDLPVNRELIENRDARIEPVEFSSCFDDYVTQLPWEISGNRLNWAKIPNSICVKWDACSDAEAKSFVSHTTLAKYKDVAVVFSAKQPALVCSYNFLVDNMEVFFFHFHGAAYFVGYSEVQLDNSAEWDFLEVEVGNSICGIKES